MTKAELIDHVAEGAALTKRQTDEILEDVFLSIRRAVKKDGRFAFPGFGTFTVTSRAARTGRNPATGATIKIAASKSVRFKPAPGFKSIL